MKSHYWLLLGLLTAFLPGIRAQKLDFPAWEEGVMELHHINTGRGDAAFMVLPDGTTLLVDAGDMSETHERTTSRRNAALYPNRSKSAPDWIADYIRQFMPSNRKPTLDYALITHFHDDHFGEADSLRKRSRKGYQLTGITAVGDQIPIRRLIDRGTHFPIDLKDPEIQAQERFSADPYGMIATLKEYWKFAESEPKRIHEALQVGHDDQIRLQFKPDEYREFKVQNIAASGVLWTGFGTDTFSLFRPGEYPGENPLSACIRIDYGNFNYFTGGDIAGMDGHGQADMQSVEAHVAPLIGPVDVATLNHHGNRDSQHPYYVRTLRPRVWIQQNWTADHPGEEVLRRVLSTELYPGPRDIFSTIMLDGTRDVIGDRLNRYAAQWGHIVVRVYDGGDRYEVFILNHLSENREVISHHGPYESR